MKVININDVPAGKVEMVGANKVQKQIPIAAADGTPQMSWRVFTMAPGGYTPYHVHPYEHINYIIEGEGELIKEDQTSVPLKKGDFALVLPNEKHQYRNTSPDKAFKMICGVQKDFE